MQRILLKKNGGAIYFDYGSKLNLNKCKFTNNKAKKYGKSIYAYDKFKVKLTKSKLKKNSIYYYNDIPKIIAKSKTFKSKIKIKKYIISLKDKASDKPIKQAQVTLKIKGKTYHAKTNKKGKATFKIKNLNNGGTYKAVIKFKGNKKYKATKKTIKIKISGPYIIKIGKYKCKLTNKQYQKLKNIYKNDRVYDGISVKTNKKYHEADIQYLNGYEGQSELYYSRGLYASVWDTRYGIDGTKIENKRIYLDFCYEYGSGPNTGPSPYPPSGSNSGSDSSSGSGSGSGASYYYSGSGSGSGSESNLDD